MAGQEATEVAFDRAARLPVPGAPMIRIYKYRIKNRSARDTLSHHAYAVNQVWNWCAAQQRDVEVRYRAGARKRKWLTHFDLAAACKGVGGDLGIHQQTVQAVCHQFSIARNSIRAAPGFRASFGEKRARGWVPFQQQSRQVSGNSVTYRSKRYRFFEAGRPLPDAAKGGFFIEDGLGRWFVCFHVEVTDLPTAAAGEIGVDLGLKALATTSAGEVIENPRHLQQHAERLAVAQRAGNKRRAKAIHARITNSRRDFHHKTSTRLARDYAFIAVGNVNAKSLAKTRMAKSVLDAGWSAFRRMLAYKAAQFVEVDERFTTQTCSSCGTLPPERPKGIADLGIRAWQCSSCGESHGRDVNAARNILRLALGVQRLAEESRRAA